MARNELKAKIRLEGDAKSADRAIKTTEKGLKRLTSFLTSRFVITLGDVTRAARAAFDGLKKSLDLSAQERVLRSQLTAASKDFDTFISKAKEAANQTVSTADIIANATRGRLLGLGFDDMIELLAISRVSAVATGATVSKAFDDITLGIARESRMILDNQGFVINMADAHQVMADQLGKSVEELTKAEKSQSLLNQILVQGRQRVEEFGKAAGGLKETLEKATASSADFKKALGEIFAEFAAGATSAAEFGDSVGKITERLTDSKDEANLAGTAVALYVANLAEGQNSIEAAVRALFELGDVTEKARIAADAQAASEAKLLAGKQKKAKADKEAAAAAEIARVENEKLTKSLEANAGAYEAAVDAASVFGEVTSVQLANQISEISLQLEIQKTLLKEDSREYQRYAEIGRAQIESLQERIVNLRDGLGDLKRDTRDAGDGLGDFGTAAKGAASDANTLARANEGLATSFRNAGQAAQLGAGTLSGAQAPLISGGGPSRGTFTVVGKTIKQLPNGRIVVA